MAFLQQVIGRIADFEINLEQNRTPEAMSSPCMCWNTLRGIPCLWLSLRRQISEKLSPNLGWWEQDTQRPAGKFHLALGSPALDGLLCAGGTTSWWDLLLCVLWSPKPSARDHELARVCAGLSQGGCSDSGMWEGMNTAYQGDNGEKQWWIWSAWWAVTHTRVSWCVWLCKLMVWQGSGAGFLSYQASMLMVNNLCYHPSWESKNEWPCAPQEQYLSSPQQRTQSQSSVRYNRVLGFFKMQQRKLKA